MTQPRPATAKTASANTAPASAEIGPAGAVQTPSQVLAQQVAHAFLTAQHIRPEDHEAVEAQLARGSMKAEDWITLAENALMSPAKPEPR